MINCLTALTRRKQNLSRANFTERKFFTCAGQVITQLELGASEPARRNSQKKPYPVPRAAGEVLGFVPSLPPTPIAVPPRPLLSAWGAANIADTRRLSQGLGSADSNSWHLGKATQYSMALEVAPLFPEDIC